METNSSKLIGGSRWQRFVNLYQIWRTDEELPHSPLSLQKNLTESKMDHSQFGYIKMPGTPMPIPLEKPPFTLKEIREAIPPHCFNRSLPISLSYLFVDLVLFFNLLRLSGQIPHLSLSLQLVLWPTYCILQGVFMSGIFVLGHECGHMAFSKYVMLNDVIGCFCHSLTFTPYMAFKIGHKKHHHFTNNCEHDEIFVPPNRAQLERLKEGQISLPEIVAYSSAWQTAIEESPLYNFLCMMVKFTIFFPAYILFSQYRLEKYEGRNMNLFSPSCALYTPQDYTGAVLWSDLGMMASLVVNGYLAVNWGWALFLLRMVIPYLCFNFYFSITTFLQHTDTYLPRFRDPEWSWLKGALNGTVDRSLGAPLDAAVHHIMDTHVVHHLFPVIPFYHAQEATEAVKKVLGKYYLTDDTPIFQALMRAYNHCKFIECTESIVFCKKSL